MKWKQKGCKQANKEMGKFDYTLWYGRRKNCYQVQGLIRNRPVKRRSLANARDHDGNFISHEELCFGSIKAARRYVCKHKQWLIDDYAKNSAGRKPPQYVIVMPWRNARKNRLVIKLN